MMIPKEDLSVGVWKIIKGKGYTAMQLLMSFGTQVAS